MSAPARRRHPFAAALALARLLAREAGDAAWSWAPGLLTLVITIAVAGAMIWSMFHG